MRNFYKKHVKRILLVIALLALVQSVLTLTIAGIPQSAKDKLPWLVVGTAVTEVLFISGLVMMAVSAEHALGKNFLRWRRHLKEIAGKVNRSKLFWTGFWVNAAGALGTGLLWLWAIFTSLPLSAWGTVLLPVSDIFLTIVLRLAIMDARKALLAEE